nr:hypothetical protein CFP56_33675 [Quercus suber]POE56709.1 hypothetical protein CFP56_33681 [Quercus suber]
MTLPSGADKNQLSTVPNWWEAYAVPPQLSLLPTLLLTSGQHRTRAVEYVHHDTPRKTVSVRDIPWCPCWLSEQVASKHDDTKAALATMVSVSGDLCTEDRQRHEAALTLRHDDFLSAPSHQSSARESPRKSRGIAGIY